MNDADEGSGRADDRVGSEGSTVDVVIGAVAVGQERMLAAARPLARAAVAAGSSLGRLRHAPGLRAVGDAADRARLDLARRGAQERIDGVARVRTTADDALTAVVASELLATTMDEVIPAVLPGILEAALPPVLERLAGDPALLVPVVDAVLEPVLESVLPLVLDRLASDPALLTPVVDAVIGPVLPDVLATLGEDPEPLVALVEQLIGPILDVALPQAIAKLGEDPTPVREVVLGQSTTIATELAAVGRSRLVTGDDIVERVARRLTFRRPRDLDAPPAPAGLPAGDPPRPDRSASPLDQPALPADRSVPSADRSAPPTTRGRP